MPPLPGACSRHWYVLAATASRTSSVLPSSVTAWRIVFVGWRRDAQAEFATWSTFAANASSCSIVATISSVEDSGSFASDLTLATVPLSTGSGPSSARASSSTSLLVVGGVMVTILSSAPPGRSPCHRPPDGGDQDGGPPVPRRPAVSPMCCVPACLCRYWFCWCLASEQAQDALRCGVRLGEHRRA